MIRIKETEYFETPKNIGNILGVFLEININRLLICFPKKTNQCSKIKINS